MRMYARACVCLLVLVLLLLLLGLRYAIDLVGVNITLSSSHSGCESLVPWSPTVLRLLASVTVFTASIQLACSPIKAALPLMAARPFTDLYPGAESCSIGCTRGW